MKRSMQRPRRLMDAKAVSLEARPEDIVLDAQLEVHEAVRVCYDAARSGRGAATPPVLPFAAVLRVRMSGPRVS